MAAEGNEACSPCCSNSQAEETTCTRALNQAEYALCRICHCEDTIDNLDSPCNCKGSLQFVHRKCLQKWTLQEKAPGTPKVHFLRALRSGGRRIDTTRAPIGRSRPLAREPGGADSKGLCYAVLVLCYAILMLGSNTISRYYLGRLQTALPQHHHLCICTLPFLT